VESLESNTEAVRLSTAHKAKGQEWQHVIIFRCIDGKWGNPKIRERTPLPQGILEHAELAKEDATADDRRLFYVALTRAQRTVTITYPKAIMQGTKAKDTVPSIFIAELGDMAVEQPMQMDIQDPVIQKTYLEKLVAPPRVNQTATERQKQYLGTLTENYVWSASALNEYLKSIPDFITNRLLRIPRPTEPALAFGTAIHSALEHLFKEYVQHHEWPSLASIQDRSAESLAKCALTPTQTAERTAYSKEVLAKYYSHATSQDWQPFKLERSFGKGWSKTSLEGVQLTGKIDRIDWVDIEAKTVRVIDYKTGKQKTMGDIEGTTKTLELSERELALPETIRTQYQRQILFYKLLTELDQSFTANVVAGRFEFVEADKTSAETSRLILKRWKI
jgi:DNA helicase-2/ATP-dependent DNA helicase PcrA